MWRRIDPNFDQSQFPNKWAKEKKNYVGMTYINSTNKYHRQQTMKVLVHSFFIIQSHNFIRFCYFQAFNNKLTFFRVGIELVEKTWRIAFRNLY